MFSCMQGEKSSEGVCMMVMLSAVHMGIRTWCVGGAGARGGAQGLSRGDTTRGRGEERD